MGTKISIWCAYAGARHCLGPGSVSRQAHANGRGRVFRAVCLVWADGAVPELFAEIRTDETGIAIRKTFLPATRIAYDDITGMFYDAMHARMMLVLNGTKRVAFVYQYEDVQGFIQLLAAHCKQLQQGEDRG